jgi:prepilin-type N-terminal cleavage/methylation domain-containing protein
MGGIDPRIGRRSRGITLPELLVVVAIIGLAVAVAVPLISDAVRSARVRKATDELAVSLMAARMLAVTKRTPVDVTVAVDPANYYEYPGRDGKLTRFDMPLDVRIVNSTSPITFQPNGMVDGGASTRLEARVSGNDVEVWNIKTSVLGVTSVERQVNP